MKCKCPPMDAKRHRWVVEAERNWWLAVTERDRLLMAAEHSPAELAIGLLGLQLIFRPIATERETTNRLTTFPPAIERNCPDRAARLGLALDQPGWLAQRSGRPPCQTVE